MARIHILHISDLHFGSVELVDGETEHRSAHYFTRAGSDIPDPHQLAQILIDDFAESPPDIVVVSGDIGHGGKTADYELAIEFFAVLRGRWTNANFVLVPGNHDVDRAASGDVDQQAGFLAFLERFYESTFDEVHPLFELGDRDTLINVQTVAVEGQDIALVVSMNSAAGLREASTPVRIDPEILVRLDRHLSTLQVPENALKIFVLHHHLLPFAESPWGPTHDSRRASERGPDRDLLANSAKLHTWLVQRHFHLVLHGHKHTSHARQDQLWRRSDQAGRSLLIVGAGTTGANAPSRAPGELLTFNRLTATRYSTHRWQIRVAVREIAVDQITPEVRPHYHFSAITGDSEEDRLHPVFRAERMDDCHRAIADFNQPTALVRNGSLHYNFLSVVEDSDYYHPSSARLRGEHIAFDLVRQCFDTLHPEHGPTAGWSDLANVDRHLRQAQLGYQFEHGSRLFQSPDNRVRNSARDVETTSPLLQVINHIRNNQNTSKGYVSLYRAQIDVLSAGRQPLPGLMGLHFIRRDGVLDLTATFRKLELSFWWCLNMYELGEVLRWVSGRLHIPAGRLSFFADLAEWKWNPDAPIRAEIDRKGIAELLPLVLDLDRSKGSLVGLLRNKQELVNDTHLSGEGLVHLEQLLRGLSSADNLNPLVLPLARLIAQANQAISEAINADEGDRERRVRACTDSLQQAIDQLSGSSSTS